jgi:hypothetical protein
VTPRVSQLRLDFLDLIMPGTNINNIKIMTPGVSTDARRHPG